MKSRTLFAVALTLLTPLAVLAFQSQADNVRKGELKDRPFTAGPLKITIVDFYGGGIDFPDAQMMIEVENTSDDFTTFDPQRLSFVNDNSNQQVDIVGIVVNRRNWVVATESKRIGPKAWIKNLYTLTDKAPLPLRVYYEDKLLGTIVY
jgi:hypothetical protein